MSKIDELTPEQEALLPVWRDRGLALGLSTTPLTDAEWDRVEAGTRECYRLAGLEQPRVMLRMDSPYSVVLAQNYSHTLLNAVPTAQVWDRVRIQVRNQVRNQVRDQVWNQVEDQVWNQVIDQVWNRVEDQVGNQVIDQVWNQVWDRVRNQVRDQVSGQVMDQVRNQVRNQVWDQVSDQVRGQVWDLKRSVSTSSWDAGWLNWIRFWRETGIIELDPKTIEKLDAWSDHALTGVSSWFPQVFVASDRPAFIHRDRQGNLHAENGQAIGWRDGWGINAWHGTRLPDDFWDWDAEKALSQANSEHRRCWLEAFGWGPVLDQAELISDEPDVGNSGHRLRLYRLPDDVIEQDVLLLTMVNGSDNADGSRREYGELVDDRFTSALEASAAGYGLTADEYRLLEVRR